MRLGFLSTVALSLILAASALAADTFKIDTVHSHVVFRVQHMGAGMTWGRFNTVTGSFVLDSNDVSKSRIEAVVDVASIDTNHEGRDGHLKSPDFFDAKQFPQITFRSTSVAAGKEANTLDVTGDLTLHGVTKSINVTMTKTGTGKGMKGETLAGLEGVFTLKRSDYGMAKLIPAAGDEVRLIVALEGIQQ